MRKDMNETHALALEPCSQRHTIKQTGKRPYELSVCRSETHGFHIEATTDHTPRILTGQSNFQETITTYAEMINGLKQSGALVEEIHEEATELPAVISPLKAWRAERWLTDENIYFQEVPRGKRYLLHFGSDGTYLYDHQDQQQPVSKSIAKLVESIQAVGIKESALEVVVRNSHIYVLDIVRIDGENIGVRSGLKRCLRLKNLEAILGKLSTGLFFVPPVLGSTQKRELLEQLKNMKHHAIIVRNINASHVFRLTSPNF